MKRPSFQFYPGDWLEEIGLRRAGLAGRGLWVDMLCYMHQGEPYGHLRKAGQDITPPELARMVGEPVRLVTLLLADLDRGGVFSRTPSGTIYSRRQVRDEQARELRAAGGVKGAWSGFLSGDNPNASRPGEARKGGRPASLYIGEEPPLEPPSHVYEEPPLEPPPSSPSSSSSSTDGYGAVSLSMEGVPEEQRIPYAEAVWQAFILRSQAPTRLCTRVEFETLRAWMDAGIPLRVVLQAIAETPRVGRVLGYYAKSVAVEYERWRLAVGGTR